MKKIGILGGLASEGTVEYYKELISLARERWDYKCPEIIIYSLNEEEYAECMMFNKDYAKAKSILSSAINSLYRAGADFVIMAANTPHVFFDEVVETSPIPLLSVAEEVAKEADARGFHSVGLMGTKATVEGGFYKNAFEKRGIQLFVPTPEAEDYIHKKIVEEMVRGIFRDETRTTFIEIIREMGKNIEAMILASTVIPLLLSENDIGMPFLDTTKVHALSAFNYCIREDKVKNLAPNA